MARKVMSLELTLEHSDDSAHKFKNLSTDGAQGAVFNAHSGAQQRLCGQV
jgi:hypothetical protein